MGRITLQDGEVIEEVKKVTDTHDGFLRIERFVHGTTGEIKPTKIIVEIISKEKVKIIEDMKIWESRGKI